MTGITTVALEDIYLLQLRARARAEAEGNDDAATWSIPWAELDALTDYGVATCTSCETAYARCSFCAGAVHCDCEAPGDCLDDARRDEADYRRADDQEDD